MIGLETPPDDQRRAPRRGSASTSRRRGRRRADLARPRRHARDRRGRGGRARSARRRAVHAAARRAMFGRLTPRAAAAPRSVEDVLVGAGLAEAYTPSLRRRTTRTRTRCACPSRSRSEHAVLRTTLLPSLVDAARRNVDAGTHGIALFEIARVYLPPAEQLPDERRHVAGIVEGGFGPGRRARRDAATRRCGSSRSSSAPQNDLLHPGKAARDRRRLASASCIRRCSRGRGACSSSTSTTLFEAAPRAGALRGRDHATRRCGRISRSSSTRTCAPASSSTAAREAAGPELREARVFDVYRGEQVGAGRKSVALRRRVPVARAHALRRGRGRAPRARSSQRSPSASAPSCAALNPVRAAAAYRSGDGDASRTRRSPPLAVAVLGAAGGAGAQGQTLTGVVGPGFSIRLTDSTGAAVKHLDPGTYTIQIQDLSPDTTSTSPARASTRPPTSRRPARSPGR